MQPDSAGYHAGQDGTDEAKRTRQVGTYRLVPEFVRGLVGVHQSRRARVIYQDINLSEDGCSLVDHPLAVRRDRHVSRDGNRAAARFPHGSDHLVQRGLPPARYADGSACFGEEPGGCRPYARSASRDERDAIVHLRKTLL